VSQKTSWELCNGKEWKLLKDAKQTTCPYYYNYCFSFLPCRNLSILMGMEYAQKYLEID